MSQLVYVNYSFRIEIDTLFSSIEKNERQEHLGSGFKDITHKIDISFSYSFFDDQKFSFAL